MFGEKTDRFFENICVHTGLAVIATDEHFHIRFWNAAAGRLFGGSAETMLGQPIVSVMPAEQRGLFQRLLERALNRGEVKELEFRYEDPTGRDTYLAVTVSPITEQSRGNVGVSICIRDVTRGMEMVREVAEAQRMSALGLMAGAVAHHFNNLLGGAITTIDFAQTSDNPELLRRTLEATASVLARASSLTQSLLAFAEGDRSSSPTAEATAIVQGFVARYTERWAEQDIVVETELESLPATVPVKYLLTVLEMLASNACQAMLDGGTLRFELSGTDEGQILLRVCDTGVGMTAEHRRHAFEPFFTTRRAPGDGPGEHVGLGLAVVHGIVKDMGGTVALEPAEGGGTVCSVRLPAEKV